MDTSMHAEAEAAMASLLDWRAFEDLQEDDELWIWNGQTAYYYTKTGLRGGHSSWDLEDVKRKAENLRWVEISVPEWFNG